MAKKKNIDEAALLKMIEEGAHQSDVMEQFGFKTTTQLKVAYANACMNAGKIPELKAKKKTPKKIKTIVSVNSRGSLIIPKAIMEHLEFKEDDYFEVSKSKAGLRLKSIEEPQKVIVRKAADK